MFEDITKIEWKKAFVVLDENGLYILQSRVVYTVVNFDCHIVHNIEEIHANVLCNAE